MGCSLIKKIHIVRRFYRFFSFLLQVGANYMITSKFWDRSIRIRLDLNPKYHTKVVSTTKQKF